MNGDKKMYDDGVEDDDYIVTGCDPEEYEDGE